MDSKNVKKVSIHELMQIAVKKYNINDDITFSKQAIEKFMRDIFHDKKSPYYSFIEKVSAKDRKDNFTYFIPVTKETVNLVTNIIVLYNMVGPVVLKSLIFENKFKKNTFNERIGKINNDIRQLELLSVNQDVLYKLFDEPQILNDSKMVFFNSDMDNKLSSNNKQVKFSDFIKSIDIMYELSSSKISSFKHLSYEDSQLLLYPNKINIKNDKDKLIRDIELSMQNNQLSISDEIIDEALLKYPDEIILYYIKFKLYYKAERQATNNFNREYLTEDNTFDHPELLDMYGKDALNYRDKMIDILLKILELWPESERKYRQGKYKQIDYDEILYYLIKYRNLQPKEYEIIETKELTNKSCYTEQFFKDSYELYKKECELYDAGNVLYSYEEYKTIVMQTKSIKCEYQESNRDKKILSYIKITDLIYDRPEQITEYDMLEFFRKTSPERYDEYLQQWKKQFYNINIYNNKKPLPFYYIEKVLSGYHEYYGEFQYSGDNYFRDAFEPEELKSLLDNMKAKYIEYIENLFSVNYTRFYVEQKCNHVDDDFIDDDGFGC